MMNTVLRKIASVAIYSVVLFSASAETLAWYHFSEQEDGVQASMAENVIKDSSPRQKDGSVFTVHNKAVVTDDSLLPTYRTYECLVDDPLNGVQMSNGTALDFAAIGTSSAQTGSVVHVSSFMDGSSPFGSITVEALICTTGGTYNTFSPIVGYCSGEGACLDENWSLLLNPSGKIAVRFSGNISGGTSYSSGTHAINDGHWHAVALVHDAEKDFNAQGQPVVRVYVDGAFDAQYSFSSKRQNYSNGPLLIGGYYGNIHGRLFNGLIDEVRISDVALAPEQLLKVVHNYPIDADTLIYIPFDGVPGFRDTDTPNLNLVENGPSARLKRSAMGTTTGIPPVEFVTDRCADFIARGRFSQEVQPNGASLRFSVSEDDNGWGVECARSTYMATSFTAELFFKSDGQVTGTNNDVYRNILRCGRAGSESMFLKIGDKLHFVHNNYDAESQTYKACWHDIGDDHEFDDGKWHHFAIVYDRDEKRICLYADWRIRCLQENVDLEPTDYLFFINNNPAGDFTRYFKGWVDEFRFTKRALKQTEFLSIPNDGKDTLFRASFENDWKATSSWGALADGAAIGAADFADAKTERLAGDFVCVTNGGEEVICGTNRYAAKVNRGYVGFPEFSPYEGNDLTIELFVKMTAWDEQANVFRLVYGDNPNYDGNPICAAYPTAKSGAAVTSLSTRIAYSTNYYYDVAGPNDAKYGVEWNYLTLPSGVNLGDGRWHHLAFVASNYVDAVGVERTRTTIYVDHTKGGSHDHVGHYAFRSRYSPRPRLSLGCGASNTRMTAAFDEVRITARALEPEDFLSMVRIPRGTVLMIR